MVQTVTPLPISNEQIAKLNDLLAAALRKKSMPRHDIQRIIETYGGLVARDWVTRLQMYIDAKTEMPTRRVTVDRSRTFEQAARAAAGSHYIHVAEIVGVPPVGEAVDMTVVLFQAPRDCTLLELEQCYDALGLVRADPFSVLAAYEAELGFLKDHRIVTHWKDAHGDWSELITMTSSPASMPIVIARKTSGPYYAGFKEWLAGNPKVTTTD